LPTRVGRLAGQLIIVLAVYALPLFLPAGIQAWLGAWVFLALWFGFWLIVLFWLSRHNPALLAERMRVSAANQQGWDRVFSVLINVTLFAWLLFIAFDAVRFHWSPVPGWLQIVGAMILLCSFYVLFRTFRENSYLSPVVRIQEERGQTVISTGPYRYVRHPMYAGMVVFVVGTPLLLGSWYGVFLGGVFVLVLARRAVLEERTLRRELPGYEAYMAEVRYRLIPYIW
jgi:protein-S-isoprenylcysteine O-methyltransferase Ste14